MSNRAALYLRSSKDRSDVSIDAQRRALQELAAAKCLVVVEEFADAVESGKDEDRPAFQAVIRNLKAPGRAWEHMLVLDTSRVARRRHIALIFEHECDRAGVRIHYKNVPDTDPITGMLLKSILQAMDEWHSLTSKAKGLAGMAENVRQGWRAGGKAPRGYKLEYHSTGAIRDGHVVTKSKLAPSEEAPPVQAYLRARAAGKTRGQALALVKSDWPAASLNDMEWMAYTYAGHTAWNTTNERTSEGYATGEKRKPRANWLISRNTHPALITDEEAEALFAQLDRRRYEQTRQTEHPFLLTGLLMSPAGEMWHGEWDRKMGAGLYRIGKGKRVAAHRIDTAVIEQMRVDLLADDTIGKVLACLRRATSQPIDAKKMAVKEKRIEALRSKVASLVDLITEAGEHERAAYRRTIAAYEGERAGLVEELAALREQASQNLAAKQFTEADARRLLRLLFDSLDSDEAIDTKTALGSFVEKIVLDTDIEHCHIHYRLQASLPATGVSVATLRDTEATPVRFRSTARIVARHG